MAGVTQVTKLRDLLKINKRVVISNILYDSIFSMCGWIELQEVMM
jgi:hypothetical protein